MASEHHDIYQAQRHARAFANLARLGLPKRIDLFPQHRKSRDSLSL